MRACSVCGDPIESGRGEPCVICGAWFHLELRKAPHAPACGIATDNYPGLCSCGISFICGACAEAEGMSVPVPRRRGAAAASG